MGFTQRTIVAVIIGLLPLSVQALRLNINVTIPFVYIQVGHGLISSYGMFGPPAGLVDEVTFGFPPGVQAGDGTDVIGTPVIPVMVLGYSGGNRSRYTVTMNSSVPLTSGSGNTIPFSEFSWTTQDGDIPAGTFDGGAQQTLVTMDGRGRRARGLVDYLTFSYGNDNAYPAGTYQGRVVYTITNL
jgi:hypothetical protein